VSEENKLTNPIAEIPLSKIYVDDEIKQAVIDVIDGGHYILGEKVREFEEEFAKFCGTKYAICASSGTAALFLSLLAINVKPDDELIAPSFSFIATASPIIHVRAKPVFVDINLKSYTINPEKIKSKISKNTKALIPVHLFGQPANMDPIMDLAKEKDLIVIEDACQAHGSEYKKRKVGGIGNLGFFSFYPSKNMTVCGDGGIATTNDEEIAEKIRMLRDHGRKAKYTHDIIGYNLRFNEIQAAVGLIQLRKLSSWNENRRKNAELYNNLLKDCVDIDIPIEQPNVKHVYHMYVIRTKKREALREFLKKNAISTGIHYPVPIHMQPAFQNFVEKDFRLENSEEAANTVLSLPMYPSLEKEKIEYITSKITDFFKN
jgi:perosamine synthetase